MSEQTINVVLAGIGGQGVLKSSDILADAAFRAGLDVKKAEVHGMSQRGGSVSSDVRFGRRIHSPMVPDGAADFVLVLEATQTDCVRNRLRPGGLLLEPDAIDMSKLPLKQTLNTAMLGWLSTRLPAIPREAWEAAIRAARQDRPARHLSVRPVRQPDEEIVRLHASSGTTGKPIVVAYTQGDMDVWTSVMVRTFAACGVRRGDIVQNAYGYGLFTGGLGAHYGAEALGATVIPISGGNTERQIMVMKDFGVTGHLLHAELLPAPDRAGARAGIDMRSCRCASGVFGAEPWTEAMRQRIEADSGIKAYDIYGLSEIIGPGVGQRVRRQAGCTSSRTISIPRSSTPETGRTAARRREGELVLTTLSKQAMPMIRYRTRDITRFIAEPCACGRTIRRIRASARAATTC
jgi:hypothetical protein